MISEKDLNVGDTLYGIEDNQITCVWEISEVNSKHVKLLSKGIIHIKDINNNSYCLTEKQARLIYPEYFV